MERTEIQKVKIIQVKNDFIYRGIIVSEDEHIITVRDKYEGVIDFPKRHIIVKRGKLTNE